MNKEYLQGHLCLPDAGPEHTITLTRLQYMAADDAALPECINIYLTQDEYDDIFECSEEQITKTLSRMASEELGTKVLTCSWSENVDEPLMIDNLYRIIGLSEAKYMHVQTVSGVGIETYDYTLFDKDRVAIDGGRLETHATGPKDLMRKIIEYHGLVIADTRLIAKDPDMEELGFEY